jgi:hypothetical protein
MNSLIEKLDFLNLKKEFGGAKAFFIYSLGNLAILLMVGSLICLNFDQNS